MFRILHVTMPEHIVEVKESAAEEAFRQGGDIQEEVVGGNIWSLEQYHEFADQDIAHEWKERLRELDTSEGTFYLRYIDGHTDSNEGLHYRND